MHQIHQLGADRQGATQLRFDDVEQVFDQISDLLRALSNISTYLRMGTRRGLRSTEVLGTLHDHVQWRAQVVPQRTQEKLEGTIHSVGKADGRLGERLIDA